MESGAMTVARTNEEVVPLSKVKLLKNKIRQLERILGQKTVQTEILKEAVILARAKN
ncbi:MAG: hypothetical protein H7069_13075 [Phormidesmis sp. FL-bin-119]|nr:hypothetical protein [Pedobacter sp.]